MGSAREYLNFFTQVFELSPIAIVSLFALSFFRLAPIVVLAPFLGSKLPSPVKVGVIIAFSLVVVPRMAMTSQTMLDFNMMFILYAIKEVLIGSGGG